MPVVKVGKSRQVVIPKEIWDELQLRAGDYFEVIVKKGTIAFVPKKLVDRDEWYWSAEGQADIAEALEDIEVGRIKEFTSVDALIEELEA